MAIINTRRTAKKLDNVYGKDPFKAVRHVTSILDSNATDVTDLRRKVDKLSVSTRSLSELFDPTTITQRVMDAIGVKLFGQTFPEALNDIRSIIHTLGTDPLRRINDFISGSKSSIRQLQEEVNALSEVRLSDFIVSSAAVLAIDDTANMDTYGSVGLSDELSQIIGEVAIGIALEHGGVVTMTNILTTVPDPTSLLSQSPAIPLGMLNSTDNPYELVDIIKLLDGVEGWYLEMGIDSTIRPFIFTVPMYETLMLLLPYSTLLKGLSIYPNRLSPLQELVALSSPTKRPALLPFLNPESLYETMTGINI